MGKNNRQRRAAKAQRKTKQRSARDDRFRSQESSGTESFTTRELADGLLDLAAAPARAVDDESVTAALKRLYTLDRAVVAAEAERSALRSTGAVWNGGWQPSELVRQVQRTTNGATTRLALVSIAADHQRRRAYELDPRWIDQLDRLAVPHVASPTGWLTSWAEREQMQWPETVRAVVAFLRCLHSLSCIEILIPPPGTPSAGRAPLDQTSTANDPILERVRALLAQAESTTFEAEAEAFTTKAQELITRHAIDIAILSARTARSETPITLRVPIDDPYADAKSLLLQVVAQNSRCRAVYYDRYAMSAVVGFASDLAATEMLFTSLLVQAQAAMQAAAAAAPSGARTRSRSFRAAFLVAYAQRIGTRLEEINTVVTAAADTDGSIVPVLAARSSVVDAAVDEMFGQLRETPVRGYDSAGWASGNLAADLAQLNSGDLISGDADAELLQLAIE